MATSLLSHHRQQVHILVKVCVIVLQEVAGAQLLLVGDDASTEVSGLKLRLYILCFVVSFLGGLFQKRVCKNKTWTRKQRASSAALSLFTFAARCDRSLQALRGALGVGLLAVALLLALPPGITGNAALETGGASGFGWASGSGSALASTATAVAAGDPVST